MFPFDRPSDFVRRVVVLTILFGAGMALYFASQGAGRLAWPLLAGLLRITVAVGGGYLVLRLTGSLSSLYAAVALALFAFGALNIVAVWRGTLSSAR